MVEAIYPILVLTLQGDDDRRSLLTSALDQKSLDYELIYGVDGRAGLTPEHEPWIDRNLALIRMGRRLSDGEFACALSHLQMYDLILKRGRECLIFCVWADQPLVVNRSSNLIAN